MRRIRVIDVLALSILVLVPRTLLAQEATEAEEVREFPLQHVDVKDANVIVRSTLSPRRLALDERRQVYIVTDTPRNLDRIGELLAMIDVPGPEWTVSLVARGAGGATTLRTATVRQGRLEVQYGLVPTTGDSLGVTATITRAASGEVDLEWSMSLTLAGRPPESARAQETLHDGATVSLLAVNEPYRRERLRRLLGADGIETLVLEIRRRAEVAPARAAVAP